MLAARKIFPSSCRAAAPTWHSSTLPTTCALQGLSAAGRPSISAHIAANGLRRKEIPGVVTGAQNLSAADLAHVERILFRRFEPWLVADANFDA